MFDPYDWYTLVNRMRSIENMVYGINANGAKYGNSMIVDYLGRTLALAARGRSMTIGAVVDVEEQREYRRRTKLHNMLQQLRTECYTYLNESMWPANKPLLWEKDYEEWAPKPSFYK
jgi:predicted amidohydrolase